MNHKNVMRLIGCCLETENPVLVFEYVEYGTLADRIYHPRQPNFEPVTCSLRLKIAMEIAYGIAYLHVAFSRPIVFRNVKPSNILFQEQSVAKLFDFSYSESIPEGETRIRGRVMGTFGYLPPEYIATGDCNEKCDVYSFGMLLLELLTGQRAVDRETEDGWFLSDRVRKYIKKSRFTEIVDPEIVGERLCSAKEQKLKAFTRLAFNCLSVSADDRPTMVDVAKQLRLMHRSEM
ncbi:WAK53a-OsWAK receptor-like protein kinase [Citrus sinensis]|uniref:WAK53a-OsWAK receptor-like protein kinase n=1 Tax=Citrus sinensis TaxID=2711 RepID=A0ACB8HWZ7_CITSI|nr:WAK53a-OsWAK receptor-like protein kinase [Citrus sinensis]